MPGMQLATHPPFTNKKGLPESVQLVSILFGFSGRTLGGLGIGVGFGLGLGLGGLELGLPAASGTLQNTYG